MYQKSFLPSPSSCNESWSVGETSLILQKDFLVLLLSLGCPGSKCMFSEPNLLQKVWLFHLRPGKWSFHFFVALTLSLQWAFGRRVQLRPSAPILQCLLPISLLSRFPPRLLHNRGIFLVRLSCRTDAVATNFWQKQGDIGPMAPNGIPEIINCFTGIRKQVSRAVVEETLLILQENQGDFLLELVAAVLRWMFSGLDLLQGVWFVHLRLEE